VEDRWRWDTTDLPLRTAGLVGQRRRVNGTRVPAPADPACRARSPASGEPGPRRRPATAEPNMVDLHPGRSAEFMAFTASRPANMTCRRDRSSRVDRVTHVPGHHVRGHGTEHGRAWRTGPIGSRDCVRQAVADRRRLLPSAGQRPADLVARDQRGFGVGMRRHHAPNVEASTLTGPEPVTMTVRRRSRQCRGQAVC
jgi:hypothetical protein